MLLALTGGRRCRRRDDIQPDVRLHRTSRRFVIFFRTSPFYVASLVFVSRRVRLVVSGGYLTERTIFVHMDQETNRETYHPYREIIDVQHALHFANT